ncbi:Tuberous sclerosis 2-like protein, partial [Linderina macrospora]
MSRGGRSTDSGRSARKTAADHVGFTAVIRNAILSAFGRDGDAAAAIEGERALVRRSTTGSINSISSAARAQTAASLRPADPPADQQPVPEVLDHAATAGATPDEAETVAVAPPQVADAALLVPPRLDQSFPLDVRLETFKSELLPSLKDKSLFNFNGLWVAIGDIVDFAFGDVAELLSTEKDDKVKARTLILSLLAELAENNHRHELLDPDNTDRLRRNVQHVISLAETWEEVALAAHCAMWATCNAQHLQTDSMAWFNHALSWADKAVQQCYPDGKVRSPLDGISADERAVLSAALEFLASIVMEEYPVLDPNAVSLATIRFCDHASRTQSVFENGVDHGEVVWVWSEADHIFGVLRLLQTVINYGALSQESLRPGIRLLCTTVTIERCEELCGKIIYSLFSSCYMRDTLLAMNHILREVDSPEDDKPIQMADGMTPHQVAINGMVKYITDVMDTGPTGFQFSLRIGNCLPVLGEAVKCGNSAVLGMVFPYLCKVVSDSRADSILADDWQALIGILVTTKACYVGSCFSDDAAAGSDSCSEVATPEAEHIVHSGGEPTCERAADEYEDDEFEGEMFTVADQPPDDILLSDLYKCVLVSTLAAFKRSEKPAPNALVELLYELRTVIDDGIAVDLLRLLDARGSLRPGATDWLDMLEELTSLYYFDHSRDISLRRLMVQLCVRAVNEAVDSHSLDVGGVPFILSAIEMLYQETDAEVIASVLSILGQILKSAASDVFGKVLEYAERSATDTSYVRPKASPSQSGQLTHTDTVVLSLTSAAQQALPEGTGGDDEVQPDADPKYPGYTRSSLTTQCLMDVLEWRMSITDDANIANRSCSSALTIQLANALLGLLESEHTFAAVQCSILGLFLRMHADSYSKLYILLSGRDTLMDQRVGLNENARLRLTMPGDDASSAATGPIDVEQFPIKRYVRLVRQLLIDNLDMHTYVSLCHGLAAQLGNTYLFDVCQDEIKELVNYLIRFTSKAKIAPSTFARMTDAQKTRLAQVSYGLLATTIHYKDQLKREAQDELVKSFSHGLIATSNTYSTPQICLHALSVCMLELPASVMRLMTPILQQIVMINSAAQISIHILEFGSGLSREHSLHVNFRATDYRYMFTAATNYIRFHNSARRRALATATAHRASEAATTGAAAAAATAAATTADTRRHSMGRAQQIDPAAMSEISLSQYTYVMAYQLIDAFYLSLSPAMKGETADHIILGLLVSNSSRDVLDEPSEVCLDMILQYYQNDGSTILNQAVVIEKEDLGPVVERSWIQHLAIVTIRAQRDGPLAQIIVRSPSNITSRVVNLPVEAAKKYADFAKRQAESNAASSDASSVATATEPSSPPPSAQQPTMAGRGNGHGYSKPTGRAYGPARNRWHSSGAGGGSAQTQKVITLPDNTIARLLHAEMVTTTSSPSYGTHFPIKFGPAPCVAQEFITAYHGLQNIDIPQLLPMSHEPIARSLRLLDGSTSTIDAHKVSVLYVGPGQTTENEIMSNRQGSQAYWNFLHGLGNTTRLSGMKGFSAGLDTSGQDTDGR